MSARPDQAAAHRRRPDRAAAPRCRRCRYFANDPAWLEQAIPGLRSLSSAYASVSADDGLCRKHDRYLSATASCADFSAA